MQQNNEQINISHELDDMIVKMLFPITNSLLIKAKELKEKKIEFRKELNEMIHRKQALIQKRKRLMKQKAIHEKNLNGDLSNSKLCEELLINYINFVDKKETDFIKDKEDFYEMKLRQKQLDFKKDLIYLIKEKTNLEKGKKLENNDSYESMKKHNKSSSSLSKNYKYVNQSFSLEKSKNNSLAKTLTTVTPEKTAFNEYNKNTIKKNSYNRNKSTDNMKTNSKNNDISREIENLINNYSSKKNEIQYYNSEESDNYKNELNQLKELKKETKDIEKELKNMMNNLLIDENE